MSQDLDELKRYEQNDLWDIDIDCVHDWNYIDEAEDIMRCPACGKYQR